MRKTPYGRRVRRNVAVMSAGCVPRRGHTQPTVPYNRVGSALRLNPPALIFGNAACTRIGARHSSASARSTFRDLAGSPYRRDPIKDQPAE
jgi:hypothetical protein